MKRVLLFSTLIVLSSCQTTTFKNKSVGVSVQSTASNSLNQSLKSRLQGLSPTRSLGFFTQPNSTQLNAIPQDPKNRLTPQKVKLGQLLYHDTSLGLRSEYPEGVGTYSCATCHHAAGGFQANRRQGISDGGFGFGVRGEQRRPHAQISPEKIDFQPIRTPAAINTAWQKNMLWNGQLGANGVNQGTQALWTSRGNALFPGIESNHLGFDGVETQAIVGQEAHRLSLDEVKKNALYQKLFTQAYPNIPENKRINQINTGLAIASFERTMMSNQSPFQRWLRGDLNAMNNKELRGALVFFGNKATCYTCHTGPALNTMRFEALGLNDLVGPDILASNPDAEANLGRGSFTKRTQDNYKFKVPQLYNLADSPFYGHGGSIRSLEAFVQYMNQGRPENNRVPQSQLAEGFKPLGLNPTEMDELVAFLKNGLRDPNLKRYQPSQVPSGNCIPNNDLSSRKDLGC